MNIRITLAVAMRERQIEAAAQVPAGTTLQQCSIIFVDKIAALNADLAGSIGVWGKIRPPHYILREGDRIEWYRALRADPKQARRSRVDATAAAKRG